MIFKTKDLLDLGETQYSIRKKVGEGKLTLLERGLYSDEPVLCFDETCVYGKYPYAVLTGISAFSFYGLTDFVPDKYYVATAQHSFPMRRNEISQSYQDEAYFDVGATVVGLEKGKVRVYDLERMLIELFRMKEKYPEEIYLEVLRNYREREDELDFHKLNRYLKSFKGGSNLAKRIREVL